MRPLAKRLSDSGLAFVGTALSANSADDHAVFMLHAGAALEHLLKGALAEQNPVLLAERKILDMRKKGAPSIAWLADEANHHGPVPSWVRTLGAFDCLTLAKAVGVPVDGHQTAFDDLMAARNGVAHMGASDSAIAEKVLPGFLGAALAIGSHLGLGASDVFGAYEGFAESQLDAHKQDLERRYAGLIEQAKVRFRARYGEYDEEHLNDLHRMIDVTTVRPYKDDQVMDCPVCEFPVVVEGQLDIEGWETTDYDSDGFPVGQSPVIIFYAVDLNCRVCGLRLDDPDLVNMSGVMKGWEPSDDDTNRLMDDFYDDLRAEHEYEESRYR